MSATSAGGSMGCRWRWSSPRHAPRFWRRPRSCGAWTTVRLSSDALLGAARRDNRALLGNRRVELRAAARGRAAAVSSPERVRRRVRSRGRRGARRPSVSNAGSPVASDRQVSHHPRRTRAPRHALPVARNAPGVGRARLVEANEETGARERTSTAPGLWPQRVVVGISGGDRMLDWMHLPRWTPTRQPARCARVGPDPRVGAEVLQTSS